MSITKDKADIEQLETQQCRVCNVQTTEYISLYKPYMITGELTTLAALLSYCANLQVLEEEHFLPGNMCKRCVGLLTQMYDFKRIALKTDTNLRKLHASSLPDNALNDPCSSSVSIKSQKLIPSDADIDEKPDADVDTDHGLESASTEDYIFVVEDPETVEVTSDSVESNQEDHPILEEISEDDFHFEQDDRYMEVFEVNYDDSTDASELDHGNKYEGNTDDKKTNIKLRTPHRPKPANPALKCLICGKQLSTSNSFKYHMQLHSDDKPFVCRICGESFKTRNAYDGHITLHDPNNPNKCRTCGKTYRQASSLRSHLFSHTGIKPFTCNICGKGLTQKSGYKKHMLTHTGEKPHSCDTCGRSFRYSSNLIAHKRSHTRKSPTTLQTTICKDLLDDPQS